MPSTPSTPATPHRRQRELGIRRPRVAGRAPSVVRPAPSVREDVGREDERQQDVRGGVDLLKATRPRSDDTAETTEHALLDGPDVEATTEIENATADLVDPEDAARPTEKRGRGRRRLPAVMRTRRRVPTLVLAGSLVVLTTAAVFFGIAGVALHNTPAAQNSALVDVGATAQVTQQLGDAAKAVFSYDFTRLDQNEAAARALIVPGSAFAGQYDQIFGQVRKEAPAQQAVVTATISTSAVREIVGDRAVMVIFLDQQATRAAAGGKPQQAAAVARLTVTGQLVDGTWKISDLQSL